MQQEPIKNNNQTLESSPYKNRENTTIKRQGSELSIIQEKIKRNNAKQLNRDKEGERPSYKTKTKSDIYGLNTGQNISMGSSFR